MAEIYFQGRTKEKRDTDANFTSSNIVLLDGEVVIVDMPDGEVRRKIGDGVTPYGQLPFDDDVVREKIDDLAEKIGDLDQLDTTAKANLVAAINEVAANAGGITEITVSELDDTRATGIYSVDAPDEHNLILVSAYDNGRIGAQVRISTNSAPDYRTWTTGADNTVQWSHSKSGLWNGLVDETTTGKLDELTTTAKDSLVAAINEVANSGGGEFPEVTNPDNATTTGIYLYRIGVQQCILIVAASDTALKEQLLIHSGGGFQIRKFTGSPMEGYIWSDWEDIVAESTVGNLDDLTTTAKNNLVAAINELAGSGGIEDLGVVNIKNSLPDIPIEVRDGMYQYSTMTGPTMYSKGYVFSSGVSNIRYDIMIYHDGVYVRNWDGMLDNPNPVWAKLTTADEVSNITGDKADLATNEKTNLVGAINELADYDEFTVTDDTYSFTTSKRNVIMHCTATEPANSSFFLNGTEQGQIITIYNPYWNGGTSDLWVDCFTPGSSGQESVNIRIGDSHTFQYAGGNLWDLEACGARLIDYGVGSDYEKVEKPAKRYFVQVPVGNTSTRDLRINNLDIDRDKKYYVNACIYAENTGHVDLFLPANFIDIVGCSTTDGVYNGTMSGDLNFDSGGSDIYMHVTGVIEPETSLQYAAVKLDVLYTTADAVNIHHRTIHGIFGMLNSFSIQVDDGYGFFEGSSLEITTV